MSYELMIDDYFCDIVNKIDLKTEKLLMRNNFTKNEADKINLKREEFIRAINRVKDYNFENLIVPNASSDAKIEDLIVKFCFIFDYLQPYEKANQEKYNDLIDDELGYLIICDKYVSEKTLELYRKFYILDNSYKNKKTPKNENLADVVFNKIASFSFHKIQFKNSFN